MVGYENVRPLEIGGLAAKIGVSKISFSEAYTKATSLHFLADLFSKPEDLIVKGQFLKMYSQYHFTATEIYKELTFNRDRRSNTTQKYAQSQIDQNNLYFMNPNVVPSKGVLTSALGVVSVNDVFHSITVKQIYDDFTEMVGLDLIWYREALTNNRIMAQISLDGNDTVRIIKAYTKLDAENLCEPIEKETCLRSQVPVYRKNEYLCIQWDGCVERYLEDCSTPTIDCEDGYTLVAFPVRPHGCLKEYCDPDFLK